MPGAVNPSCMKEGFCMRKLPDYVGGNNQNSGEKLSGFLDWTEDSTDLYMVHDGRWDSM
jgi:hypothetical protein